MSGIIRRAMRLVNDVKNPHYDGRSRYGVFKHKVFPKGTFLVYVMPHDKFTGIVEMLGNIWSCEVMDLLLKNAEPSNPQTAREAMALADLEAHTADELLQQLVDNRLITLVDIGAAGAALHARWQAEEQKR